MRRDQVILKCRVCGKDFSVKRSQAPKRRTCGGGRGGPCAREWKRRRTWAKRAKRKCAACGREFMAPESQLRHGRAKFCSWACKLKGQETGRTHPCPVCGKDVRQWPSRAARGGGIYCSRICRNRGRTLVRTEEFKRKVSGRNGGMWGRTPVHPKPVVFHSRWYGEVKMRSTYETRMAAVLERAGIPFAYEPMRFDMGYRTYVPDFYLPTRGLWIETKGWVRPEHRKLMDEFRRSCGNIMLVSRRELGKMEKANGKQLTGIPCVL